MGSLAQRRGCWAAVAVLGLSACATITPPARADYAPWFHGPPRCPQVSTKNARVAMVTGMGLLGASVAGGVGMLAAGERARRADPCNPMAGVVESIIGWCLIGGGGSASFASIVASGASIEERKLCEGNWLAWVAYDESSLSTGTPSDRERLAVFLIHAQPCLRGFSKREAWDGAMRVELEVSATGFPTEVHLREVLPLADTSDLHRCLQRTVQYWRFPREAEGRQVTAIWRQPTEAADRP